MSDSFPKLPPEQQAIRDKYFHSTEKFVEFPFEEIETSIPKRFEKIVGMYPEWLAVKIGDRALTYEELNGAANRVAHAILEHWEENEEPIALVFEQGVDIIAAILGVLKAGKIYVPLDPLLPALRNRDVLQDTVPRLIITNNRNSSLVKELVGGESAVINIDELVSTINCTNPPLRVTADTLAYIIYTSGSTGKPKGVVQNHRNILHLIMRHTNRAHITPQDRIAVLRSFNVHGGTLMTFAALLNGAAILPFDTKSEGLGELAQWLAREEITLCRMGPTLLRHLSAILRDEDYYPKLREISFSGEPLLRNDIELCRRHISQDCSLVNSFGATEISSCSEYVINADTGVEEGVIPCGYPTKDMEIFLLHDDGEEAPNEDIGEIAVKSPFLALGYWRNPELTSAKFLPGKNGEEQRTYRTGDQGRLLPDGRLVHLRRKDFQVKIRGYRVELSEIESALLAVANIREAVVVGQQDQAGEQCLVAYVVPDRQPAPSTTTLRRALQKTLPDYMSPAAFMVLNEMPLTPNGKIDRRALPPPATFRPDLDTPYVAPRNPIEEELAAIWSEVLAIDEVGIYDNFFDLGGHSLAAMRVVSRVIQTFQLEVQVKALFDSPTVAETATIIAQNKRKRASEVELAQMLREVEAMTEQEAQRLLAVNGIANGQT